MTLTPRAKLVAKSRLTTKEVVIFTHRPPLRIRQVAVAVGITRRPPLQGFCPLPMRKQIFSSVWRCSVSRASTHAVSAPVMTSARCVQNSPESRPISSSTGHSNSPGRHLLASPQPSSS
ncbi:hypothetical protein ATCV1_z247L [Acanthocystis turfacea chlorella virus 1]|uniref:Uncharacterized protein z247L n=1 Tax=Chlorovirus heliozoae TaxID=322019 RepID=A7K8K7_9PHYC|nr:hypothetical protein ATCV1_z247L [Acanthocystis turfacea chlorella virus 1]ABT16381.1 hypothetical protein ATCV1_z247L [Acanthocystis turfacea chlorella virus 1]